MNSPDHISDSLKAIFLFGSGMEKIPIRDKHPGSATLLKSWHILQKKEDGESSAKMTSLLKG
jgi:hypothetical protein